MSLNNMKNEYGFDHLPLDDHEKCKLENQVTLISSSAGYLTLFRYATHFDRAVFIASIAACMVAGAANPILMASLVPSLSY